MNLRNAIRALSTTVVGAGAAFGSYSHLHTVAHMAGENALMQGIMPLTVDGMMIVATTAMADDVLHGRTPRKAARWGFYLGIAVSMAGNVTATWGHGWLARVVALWPAVALLVVTMILDTKGAPDPDVDPAPIQATVEAPQAVVAPLPVPAPVVVPAIAPRHAGTVVARSHAHCAHASTPAARRMCRQAARV